MRKKNARKQFTRKHSLSLREEIVALLERSNLYLQPERRVSVATAIEVANRDLRKTRNSNPDARIFSALKSVSAFVSLSSKNKITTAALSNADLLPVGHPLSTRTHAMTAAGLRQERARWIAADELVDDSVRRLVLLAHAAEPGSPERAHAFARISALGPGLVPITAAVDLNTATSSSSEFVIGFGTGGNSRAARSARANLQRRDRRGRFAFMGGGFSFNTRGLDGTLRKLSGRVVGGSGKDLVEIEVRGHESVPDGIYALPSSQGDASKGILPEELLKELPAVDAMVSSRRAIDESTLERMEAPTGWTKQASRLRYEGAPVAGAPEVFTSEDGYFVKKDGDTLSLHRANLDTKLIGDEIARGTSWADIQKAALNDQDDYEKVLIKRAMEDAYNESVERSEKERSESWATKRLAELEREKKAIAPRDAVDDALGLPEGWRLVAYGEYGGGDEYESVDGYKLELTRYGAVLSRKRPAPGKRQEVATIKDWNWAKVQKAVDDDRDDYQKSLEKMDADAEAERAAKAEADAEKARIRAQEIRDIVREPSDRLGEPSEPGEANPVEDLTHKKVASSPDGLYRVTNEYGESMIVDGAQVYDARKDGFTRAVRIPDQKRDVKSYVRSTGVSRDLLPFEDENQLRTALEQARKVGDNVRFKYNGKDVEFQPSRIYRSPKTGKINVVGWSVKDGAERTYTLDKVKPAGKAPAAEKPKATIPEAPETGALDLDPSENLTQQITDAIGDKRNVRFNYSGKERDVTPVRVWQNKKTGKNNLTAREADGTEKNFTLDKIELPKSASPAEKEETPRQKERRERAMAEINDPANWELAPVGIPATGSKWKYVGPRLPDDFLSFTFEPPKSVTDQMFTRAFGRETAPQLPQTNANPSADERRFYSPDGSLNELGKRQNEIRADKKKKYDRLVNDPKNWKWEGASFGGSSPGFLVYVGPDLPDGATPPRAPDSVQATKYAEWEETRTGPDGRRSGGPGKPPTTPPAAPPSGGPGGDGRSGLGFDEAESLVNTLDDEDLIDRDTRDDLMRHLSDIMEEEDRQVGWRDVGDFVNELYETEVLSRRDADAILNRAEELARDLGEPPTGGPGGPGRPPTPPTGGPEGPDDSARRPQPETPNQGTPEDPSSWRDPVQEDYYRAASGHTEKVIYAPEDVEAANVPSRSELEEMGEQGLYSFVFDNASVAKDEFGGYKTYSFSALQYDPEFPDPDDDGVFTFGVTVERDGSVRYSIDDGKYGDSSSDPEDMGLTPEQVEYVHKFVKEYGGPDLTTGTRGEPPTGAPGGSDLVSNIFDGAKGRPASEYSDNLPVDSEIVATAGDGDILYGRNGDGSYYVADGTTGDDGEFEITQIDPSDQEMMAFLKEQFVDGATEDEAPVLFYRGGFVDAEHEKKYLDSLTKPPTGAPAVVRGEITRDNVVRDKFNRDTFVESLRNVNSTEDLARWLSSGLGFNFDNSDIESDSDDLNWVEASLELKGTLRNIFEQLEAAGADGILDDDGLFQSIEEQDFADVVAELDRKLGAGKEYQIDISARARATFEPGLGQVPDNWEIDDDPSVSFTAQELGGGAESAAPTAPRDPFANLRESDPAKFEQFKNIYDGASDREVEVRMALDALYNIPFGRGYEDPETGEFLGQGEIANLIEKYDAELQRIRSGEPEGPDFLRSMPPEEERRGLSPEFEEQFNDLYDAPEGAYKPDIYGPYVPRGAREGNSVLFTDDPSVLAETFTSQELTRALMSAVLPSSGDAEATGFGDLDFGEGDEPVPAEALLEALGQKGEVDPGRVLAMLYDSQLDPERQGMTNLERYDTFKSDEDILSTDDIVPNVLPISDEEARQRNKIVSYPQNAAIVNKAMDEFQETSPKMRGLADEILDLDGEYGLYDTENLGKILDKYIPLAFSEDGDDIATFAGLWGMLMSIDGGSTYSWETDRTRFRGEVLAAVQRAYPDEAQEKYDELVDIFGGFAEFVDGKLAVVQGKEGLDSGSTGASFLRLMAATRDRNSKPLYRSFGVDPSNTELLEAYTTEGSVISLDPRPFSEVNYTRPESALVWSPTKKEHHRVVFVAPPGEANSTSAVPISWFDEEVEHLAGGDFVVDGVERRPSILPGRADEFIVTLRRSDERQAAPEPGEAPTAEAAELPPLEKFDVTNWTMTAGQAGSNPGGFYEDENGKGYYVKEARSTSHADNEVLASVFYEELGVPAAKVRLGEDAGDERITSELIPGVVRPRYDEPTNLQKEIEAGNEEYLNKIRTDFAIDAWLSNYDVTGTGWDNIVTDGNGDPVRVDPGGALMWRARGGDKGAMFGDEVGEIDSLRDSRVNSYAGAVFGAMTDDDVRDSVKKLAPMTPDRIDALVDRVVRDPEDAAYLKKRLKNRRRHLLDRFGVKGNEEAAADGGIFGDPISLAPSMGYAAADLNAGDVTLGDSFVIERVFKDDDTPDGKVSVQGYFPGHESQRKEWNEGTIIEVSRGNDRLPPKGELPALHKPKRPGYAPTPPAFSGEGLQEILRGATSWDDVRERLRGRTLVFFDYETTGFAKPAEGDFSTNQPVQLGAVKVVDGEIVDRFNVFMDPGEPLGAWSRENLKDADGNPLTDEMLQSQIGKAEAHARFAEWAGSDAILAAHNTPFDREVLERTNADGNVDFTPLGYIDTLRLSRDMLPKRSKKNPDAPAGHKLPQLMEHYGLEFAGWHTADADSEATYNLFNSLLNDGLQNRPESFDKSVGNLDEATNEYNENSAAHAEAVKQYEQELADYNAKKAVAAAWNCGSGFTAGAGDGGDSCNNVPTVDELIEMSKVQPGELSDPEGMNIGDPDGDPLPEDAVEVPEADGTDTRFTIDGNVPDEEQQAADLENTFNSAFEAIEEMLDPEGDVLRTLKKSDRTKLNEAIEDFENLKKQLDAGEVSREEAIDVLTDLIDRIPEGKDEASDYLLTFADYVGDIRRILDLTMYQRPTGPDLPPIDSPRGYSKDGVFVMPGMRMRDKWGYIGTVIRYNKHDWYNVYFQRDYDTGPLKYYSKGTRQLTTVGPDDDGRPWVYSPSVPPGKRPPDWESLVSPEEREATDRAYDEKQKAAKEAKKAAIKAAKAKEKAGEPAAGTTEAIRQNIEEKAAETEGPDDDGDGGGGGVAPTPESPDDSGGDSPKAEAPEGAPEAPEEILTVVNEADVDAAEIDPDWQTATPAELGWDELAAKFEKAYSDAGFTYSKDDEDQRLEEEAAALFSYVEESYFQINGALRQENWPLLEAMHNNTKSDNPLYRQVHALDRLIDEAPPIPEDMILYRGVHSEYAAELFSSREVGDLIRDSSFVSTSLNVESAEEFALEDDLPSAENNPSVVLEIVAPKGTKGVSVADFYPDANTYSTEMEILLARGTTFRVIAKTEDRDGRLKRIRVAVVDQDPISKTAKSGGKPKPEPEPEPVANPAESQFDVYQVYANLGKSVSSKALNDIANEMQKYLTQTQEYGNIENPTVWIETAPGGVIIHVGLPKSSEKNASATNSTVAQSIEDALPDVLSTIPSWSSVINEYRFSGLGKRFQNDYKLLEEDLARNLDLSLDELFVQMDQGTGDSFVRIPAQAAGKLAQWYGEDVEKYIWDTEDAPTPPKVTRAVKAPQKSTADSSSLVSYVFDSGDMDRSQLSKVIEELSNRVQVSVIVPERNSRESVLPNGEPTRGAYVQFTSEDSILEGFIDQFFKDYPQVAESAMQVPAFRSAMTDDGSGGLNGKHIGVEESGYQYEYVSRWNLEKIISDATAKLLYKKDGVVRDGSLIAGTGAEKVSVLAEEKRSLSTSNIDGTPSLRDAIDSVVNKQSDIPSLSVATDALVDAGDIEDLKVRAYTIATEGGERKLRLRFKLTGWAGRSLAKKIQDDESWKKNPGVRLPTSYRDENGDVQVVSIDEMIQKIDNKTIRSWEMANATLVAGGTTHFHRTESGADIQFRRGSTNPDELTPDKISANLNRTLGISLHNEVIVDLPLDATDEDIASALRAAGVEDVRSASEDDLRVFIENRLISVYGSDTKLLDPSFNIEDQEERDNVLDFIEKKYGITPEDVSVSRDQSGNIITKIPKEAAVAIAIKSGIDYMYHSGNPSTLIQELALALGGADSEQRSAALIYANLIMSGLSPTSVRFQEGLVQGGLSSSEDLQTGGAEYVYFTPRRGGELYLDKYNETDTGFYVVFDAEDILDNTAVNTNVQDEFGRRRYDKPIIGKLSPTNHEVTIKGPVSLENAKTFIVAAPVRDLIIDELKSRGVTKINGMPVEDFVKTELRTNRRDYSDSETVKETVEASKKIDKLLLEEIEYAFGKFSSSLDLLNPADKIESVLRSAIGAIYADAPQGALIPSMINFKSKLNKNVNFVGVVRNPAGDGGSVGPDFMTLLYRDESGSYYYSVPDSVDLFPLGASDLSNLIDEKYNEFKDGIVLTAVPEDRDSYDSNIEEAIKKISAEAGLHRQKFKELTEESRKEASKAYTQLVQYAVWQIMYALVKAPRGDIYDSSAARGLIEALDLQHFSQFLNGKDFSQAIADTLSLTDTSTFYGLGI